MSKDTKKEPSKDLSIGRRFLAAGSAACVAEIVTIPIDTAKVRLQIQGNVAPGSVPKYAGMVDCLRKIAVEEGPTAIFKGLTPGLLRQMVFSSLRIGLYEPVRNFYHPDPTDPPLSKKILAGLTTGALGIMVASPTDLVKIRLQAEGRLPPGVARRYTGTFNAFSTIAKEEGIPGLWRGLGPNVARNAIITAAELASYDQIKQTILKNNWMTDDIPCHLVSGFSAGFVATVIGSPVDVIKTRVMNQVKNPDGSLPYRGAIDCFVKTLKNEGVGAFYKGFIPNFTRIGGWNTVMFLALEQFKKLLAE
eukprot:TRINITY_DN1990_c0_g1_i1.p1 TRINITY_DN1990_c0_g1~~TRINITY_DN1990_c0_g1_i1.p1  ORF type:complete len:306 (+),score=58.29 TRINITY_DN1990_c0_g1_i1:50-967(+)